ncbi:protein kinase domain-containing protein [Longimicrobium sp.]|uniref:serine/threonine-protein kinase n=1 Tax=Longimicrobium sp. TaxID=2029185 RepID=UPI002BBA734D|nr:protein kinase [Longimicrobium sp.]HSU18070.1 protein kinase [Longimicrobium sp.]
MRHPGFEGLLTGHTLLDRYHVEEVIGRGGFAAVYRATDQRLGRTVAVKVITHSGGGEVRDEIQRRFQREARAIASLHHPNVVTVFDFGTDPTLGLDFLVMELLQGEVLSERLRRPEPIPVAQALRILLDAAAGVDAGHRAGLVHRDIKPGNIFLARNEPRGGFRVYVLDFGIARFTEPDATQLTHSGRAFLSPAYASPEQLRGDRKVTPAADVFSLGVIGYQLLAREKPFARDRMGGQEDGAAAEPLRARNPQVPPAVAAVIHRAMAEDPADRYPDAGAFARALMDAQSAPVPAPDAAPRTEAAAAPIVVAAPEPPPVVEPEPVRAEAAPSPEPPPVARVEPVAAPPADIPARESSPPVVAIPARQPSPRAEEVRRDRPAHPAGGIAVRTGGSRRVSPALIAIPLLLVLGLIAWAVLGRGGRGDGDRVAERTSPPAATSSATDPAAAPEKAGTGAGAGAAAGPASQSGSPSSSPSPSPTAGSPAAVNPSGPAVPVAPRPVQPRPAPAPAGAARPAVPLPPPSAPPARTAAREPASAVAINREGEALFERGDMAGAVARFRQAVASAPGNAYYRNNLGWALFQAGRVDEAARELAETVRLDPRRDIAYANIGEVERVRGNTAAAIAAYERFLQLNTDPRRAEIARGKLRALRGG